MPLAKDRCRELLADARERTLVLIQPVSPCDMHRVHSSLMSPLAWDIGHIAAYEDLWLNHHAGRVRPVRPDLWEVYDATETPRAERGDLPFLSAAEARKLMSAVRERALAALEDADLSEGADRLNAGGFAWDMVVQHENQHNETMLQTLQLAEPGVYVPPRRSLPLAGTGAPSDHGRAGTTDGPSDGGRAGTTDAPSDGGRAGTTDGQVGSTHGRVGVAEAATGDDLVAIDGGPFLVGMADGGFAFDNERPQQEVDLPGFLIDRTPVTNGAYAAFVEAGGYRRPEWWSEEGWAWREREGIERPLYWTADGRERSFERTEPLDPARPVVHVAWYEADAYARWRGKRLPTELEWERAASWSPAGEGKRLYPWGDEPPTPQRANLDQIAFGTTPVEAHPAGASAYGVLALVGDVWEWTASDFDGYPGFRAFPYAEYSEVFFGGPYKVLRGGSWATRPRTVRTTFRNWDLPDRRQIFAGFRCAADA